MTEPLVVPNMLCTTSELSAIRVSDCNYQKYSLQSGITTLRLENRPTQMKNTELLIPMAAKLHTTSNPHNCTTATEVEGGN